MYHGVCVIFGGMSDSQTIKRAPLQTLPHAKRTAGRADCRSTAAAERAGDTRGMRIANHNVFSVPIAIRS